jgi:formylglycine-generating enzyme required for sulfatase activity
MGCAFPSVSQEDAGSRRLFVPEFWLQETPVTNALYGLCVRDSACPPPERDVADPNTLPWDDDSRVDLPVYVRKANAEAYCAWAGGRLPSLAELVRAAQGDAATPGVAAMTSATIACASGVSQDPICGQLALMNYEQAPPPPLYRVGAVPLDIGPSLHRDLFGSTQEWTRTQGGSAADGNGQFCALADGAPDFVTFPSDEPYFDVVGFATPIADAVRSPGSAKSVFHLMLDGTVGYNVGFRCAFDAGP